MVSAGTKITLPFVVVAALAWYVSAESIAAWLSLPSIVGVSVGIPVLITELRSGVFG